MIVSLAIHTAIHTAASLVAIAAGIVMLDGMVAGRPDRFWTPLFLVTAVVTGVTGFGFPFGGLLPSHIVGGLALAVLAAVLLARYPVRRGGAWTAVHDLGLLASVYFLVFVGIAQAFLKIPALNGLAPTQTEPPFAATQGVALLGTIAIGILLRRRGGAPT